MKRKIILSTNNLNKVRELEGMIDRNQFEVLTKADFGLEDLDFEEDGESLEANAKVKVMGLVQALEEKDLDLTDTFVLGDDTGLFVKNLNGAPGVHSARFAGEHASDDDNIDKILELLSQQENPRSPAYFETVIAYYIEGKISCVHGRVDGIIIEERRGDQGFGYDSIFYVEELGKTFAQVDGEDKNAISHRGKAYRAFIERLNGYEN